MKIVFEVDTDKMTVDVTKGEARTTHPLLSCTSETKPRKIESGWDYMKTIPGPETVISITFQSKETNK